ncbi:cleft lip and palate transmembrane protein 1 [Cinnamomum micranthum f. kanehirae]|uniref:Cleft lip and palate transmembrane protein 1 n=1 Tax=Cinnamomum micranthum f. kanehirae TaxID=337451 RepID=A0A443PHM9_9MAGN|nr:cleft lip and palate transmembrane protein 1 [Cinnamomum micranthum f. kanehirae]
MATPSDQQAPPQQQQRQQGFGQTITGIIRMAVFWYFAMKFFSPKKTADPSVLMSNLFQKGESLDMWLYVSEHEKFNDFGNEGALIWHETNVPYAVWGPDSSRYRSLKYFPSEAVKHNGSLYAHVFFARSGYPPDPNDPEYQPFSAFGRTHPIVAYLPKSRVDKRKSLLGASKGSEEGEIVSEVVDENNIDAKDDGPVEWASYWKPNITINLVDDFTRYPRNAIPPNIAPCILDYFIVNGHDFLDNKAADLNVEPTSENYYYPTIFFNEFWLLRDKLIPLNNTVTALSLNLELGPISMTKWQLFQQIDQSFQIHRSYGSMLEGEADELKRVFLEGNPYLLVITMVVSLLHSVFDFLAFKNDIQFWNKNKSMEGLSAKSVVVSFICQLVVFLYLLDNDTSWMILASSGVGCCIEFWKIGKAMIIEIDRSGRIPMLKFRDRESYAGNKTKEYDDLAMKYLSYVLFLLVICSSIYSLMYERHKSWYSWILSSLTSCVYMFGFIMMCPQLFINYKLKSVAHLPWRQMTYKFLNTIIDDLFAFVIKMPMLHRLSVFRDDVIFLIYLYQRWVYPVDRKRVNEFGFGGEEEDGTTAITDGDASKDADVSADKVDEKKTN